MIVPTHLYGVGTGSIDHQDTSSLTFAANCLVLISVHNKLDPSGGNIPTVSGGGVTWTQIANKASGKSQMTMFRGVSPTNGVLTVSFGGQTQQGIHISVDQFTNVVTSGAQGADGIIQSGTAAVDVAANISVSLSTFKDANNIAYAACETESGSLTAPAGFTNLFNTANFNPFSADYAVNSPTVTYALSIGNITSMIAVEVKSLPSGGLILSALT